MFATGLPGATSATIFSNPGRAISSQNFCTAAVGLPTQIGEPIWAL